jgi:hypothetical protein
MWHLCRAASAKKSAQVTGIFYSVRSEPELQISFDVIAPIQRLYHSTDLELNVLNPIPDKVTAPVATCAGPAPDSQVEPAYKPPTADQMEALKKLTRRMSTRPGHLPSTFGVQERNGTADKGGGK